MRISQTEIDKDFVRIKAALVEHENGASISTLEAVLNPRIEQRTLLRRLTKLVDSGEVRASGQNKGKLYYPVYMEQEEIVSSAEPKNDIIPLTPEAEEIRKIILQPEEKRTPVAYNFDFLMSYRPPNPDSWFTLTVKIDSDTVSAFIDGNKTPSLEVKRLTKNSGGKIGLFMGDNSGGDFEIMEVKKL